MINPITEVKEWLFTIALKKGIYTLVQVIISFLTSVKIATLLQAWGVAIDPVTFKATLTAFLSGALTMAQNYIKVKYKISWL